MDRRLRYHPLFDCDVREAAACYDRRAPALGEIFIIKVESRIAEVLANPNRFARTSTGCRYVRIPRFPYAVLFDVVR